MSVFLHLLVSLVLTAALLGGSGLCVLLQAWLAKRGHSHD